MANGYEEKGKPYPKKFLNKPFGIQGDGDLWDEFWDLLEAKGAKTVQVTKVKGHATEEDVDEGRVEKAIRREMIKPMRQQTRGFAAWRKGW